MEETSCDVVGTLLGGPAFVTALHMVLLSSRCDNPFVHGSLQYPPLDCRMRLGCTPYRGAGLADQWLDILTQGWARVQTLHQTQKPHWYDWLYDDSYLDDVVHAVEGYVRTRGLHVYEPTGTGLRQELAHGARLSLDGGIPYDDWSTTFLHDLELDYTP